MGERGAIAIVTDQHVDELAILWNMRREQAQAGPVALRHLARLDERIAANLDGCLVAGAAK